MSCLLFRIDLFAVHKNIQRTRGTGAHASGNSEFPLNIILEAHGLSLDIRSKETALDLDRHVVASVDAPLNSVAGLVDT